MPGIISHELRRTQERLETANRMNVKFLERADNSGESGEKVKSLFYSLIGALYSLKEERIEKGCESRQKRIKHWSDYDNSLFGNLMYKILGKPTEDEVMNDSHRTLYP